ncbi:50S ribosomal protein L23 [Candidatus Nomurabacteria bacterium]|nr:50S ribosomal protein L23 [Candidatus Nomurabacteria bacterium]
MTHVPTKYVDMTEDLSWVLIKPRLSEKAARLGSDENVYTFDVSPRANKIQIKKAIEVYYKVTPTKVNVVNQAPRKDTFRGRPAHVAGTKKAMVFLKKGDTINLA